MNLTDNIKLLYKDYFLAVAKDHLSFLRADVFLDKDEQYTAVFLARRGAQDILLDGSCNEVFSADQIYPLFALEQDATVLEAIRNFYKSCPSGTLLSERMMVALQSMSELCCWNSALAAAYMVRQGEHWGVVDPNGTVIIEPKYDQIKLLGVEETFQYMHDLNEPGIGRTISDAVMYVCTRFAEQPTLDVFNLAGDIVFHQASAFQPYQQMLTTAPTMDCALPRYRDTLSFYVATLDNEKEKWQLFQTDELFLQACNEFKKGTLIKSSQWRFVNLGDIVQHEKEYNFLDEFCATVGNTHGKAASEVHSYLPVYNHWRQIDTPIPVTSFDEPLDNTFPDITILAYRQLRRMNVNTVRELAGLSIEQISRIKSPLAQKEILCLKKRVDLSATKEE